MELTTCNTESKKMTVIQIDSIHMCPPRFNRAAIAGNTGAAPTIETERIIAPALIVSVKEGSANPFAPAPNMTPIKLSASLMLPERKNTHAKLTTSMV